MKQIKHAETSHIFFFYKNHIIVVRNVYNRFIMCVPDVTFLNYDCVFLCRVTHLHTHTPDSPEHWKRYFFYTYMVTSSTINCLLFTALLLFNNQFYTLTFFIFNTSTGIDNSQVKCACMCLFVWALGTAVRIQFYIL